MTAGTGIEEQLRSCVDCSGFRGIDPTIDGLRMPCLSEVRR